MKEFIISNYLLTLVFYSFSQNWAIEEMATNTTKMIDFINLNFKLFPIYKFLVNNPPKRIVLGS